MKKTLAILGLLLLAAVPARSELFIDGFLQGLYGGRTDQNNPTETEYTASETRMQLRAEHFGDGVEFFGRLDFTYDGAVGDELEWELREGYLKFRLGNNLDFKIGRQIVTWGTGDLIFINDVFAKDYQSFFVGRDDQYLKAPQNALRVEYYNPIGDLSVVWSPRFAPNRLPEGRKLSYYNPFGGGIVGTGMGEKFLFEPPEPESRFKNSEIALRLSRTIMNYRASLYYYHGFYKNPTGADFMGIIDDLPVFAPVFARVDIYGASIRGTLWGGVLWLEGGWYDSRDYKENETVNIRPNSMVTGMIGYERQVATNLTVNAQWQVQDKLDGGRFYQWKDGIRSARGDEYRHLLTSRITKLMMDENLTLSTFVFYSPTDEDTYIRLNASYKYTDELTLSVGGNIFAGKYESTEFGQFQKNDNAYVKVTYGF